jgi:hypothetical protein
MLIVLMYNAHSTHPKPTCTHSYCRYTSCDLAGSAEDLGLGGATLMNFAGMQNNDEIWTYITNSKYGWRFKRYGVTV